MEQTIGPSRPPLRPELGEHLYQTFEAQMLRLTTTCKGIGMSSDELIAYVREGNRRAGVAIARDLGKLEEAATIEDRLNNALTAALAGKARAVELKEEMKHDGTEEARP